MPLSLVLDRFAEAIAVWFACVLLFVIAVLFRRAWVRRARAAKAAARARADSAGNLGAP
jgi:hypothetical protein